mmetsp:Transcript_58837/g.164316  ORF Transcript_58837/g.164316 Transcript_58837/m.164316 type:complete len:258 (+) Transcript_58837:298-1071(+)
MLFRPLCPPEDPFCRKRTIPRGSEQSSTTARKAASVCPMAANASLREGPLSLMAPCGGSKICGRPSACKLKAPTHALVSPPVSPSCNGFAVRRPVTARTTRSPTLCRCNLNCSPTLPRPKATREGAKRGRFASGSSPCSAAAPGDAFSALFFFLLPLASTSFAAGGSPALTPTSDVALFSPASFGRAGVSVPTPTLDSAWSATASCGAGKPSALTPTSDSVRSAAATSSFGEASTLIPTSASVLSGAGATAAIAEGR